MWTGAVPWCDQADFGVEGLLEAAAKLARMLNKMVARMVSPFRVSRTG